jgi:hypothetical protein
MDTNANELTLTDVLELLDEPTRKEPLYPPPIQKGPLRRYDKEMRCANKYGLHQRECGSPTYFKVSGIPKCMTHALDDLNTMLVERGVT